MVTKMATTTLASFFYVPTALALQRVRKTSKNRLKAQIRRKIHFETKKRAPTNLGTREITGADNRIRTYDLLITNEPLYQLSYIGATEIILASQPSKVKFHPLFSISIPKEISFTTSFLLFYYTKS